MHRYLHNEIYTIPMLVPSFEIPSNLVIRFRKEEIIGISSKVAGQTNFEKKSFRYFESLNIIVKGR